MRVAVCPSPPGLPTGRAQVSFMGICQVVPLILCSNHFFRLDRSEPVYDMEPYDGKIPESQKVPFSEVRNIL